MSSKIFSLLIETPPFLMSLRKSPFDLKMDNFSTDLHNTLIDLLFEYNQKGMNVSKSQFEKEINIFIDKFYNYN